LRFSCGKLSEWGLDPFGRLNRQRLNSQQDSHDVNDATNESISIICPWQQHDYDPRDVFVQDSTAQTYSFVFYLSSQNGGVIQDVSPSNTARDSRGLMSTAQYCAIRKPVHQQQHFRNLCHELSGPLWRVVFSG